MEGESGNLPFFSSSSSFAVVLLREKFKGEAEERREEKTRQEGDKNSLGKNLPSLQFKKSLIFPLSLSNLNAVYKVKTNTKVRNMV